jgi:opacity protein-like surface antigen
MKTRIELVLGIVLILAVTVSGQQNLKLTAYAGYSLSAFEDQGSAAGTIPLGLSLGFKAAPALEVGGEFFYPLGGYEFESTEANVTIKLTRNQMMAGAYGSYLLGSGNAKPYLKAGVGYYMGDAKVEQTDYASVTRKIKSAVGFNVGGGLQLESGMSIGFVYNIVTREKSGMNTWAILVGYPIIR